MFGWSDPGSYLLQLPGLIGDDGGRAEMIGVVVVQRPGIVPHGQACVAGEDVETTATCCALVQLADIDRGSAIGNLLHPPPVVGGGGGNAA
jgi:hypothetical protein